MLKRLTHDPELWKAFVDMLEEKRLSSYKAMTRSEEIKDVYRNQGRIQLIEDLLTLKDRLK